MTYTSYHFRSTQGTIYSEANPEVAVLGDLYPTTRNSLTFGWSVAPSTKSDFSSPLAARISGRNYVSSSQTFRVDLPDGPGRYRFRLAVGLVTASFANSAFAVFDGTGSGGTPSASPLFAVGTTALTSAQVIDATGAVLTTSQYAAGSDNYVEVDVVADHVFVTRNGGQMYLVDFEYEQQVVPLTDAILTKEDGTGTATSIYSHEPTGKMIGKLSSASGTQSFAVTGTAATYFSVATIDGNKWLVTTATRLPDTFSGSITARQTASSGTHDTTFTLTVISAAGRTVDASIDGQISSRTWLERALIRTVTRGEQDAFYTGQSLTGRISYAAGDAAFKMAYDAISPDGSSWYTIRLQGGDWTHSVTFGAIKDFGSGGLLVERDVAGGHDPLIKSQFRQFGPSRLHWRDTTLVPAAFNTGGVAVTDGSGYSFYDTLVGPPYKRHKFEGNRVGHLYESGATTASWKSWNSFYYTEFIEQFIALSNTFNGTQSIYYLFGGRLFSFNDTDQQNVVKDIHALSIGVRNNVPRGVFSDDNLYVEILTGCHRNNTDLFDSTVTDDTTPHKDWLQLRRFGNSYTYSPHPNGNVSVVWQIGNKCVNAGKLYNVTAVTDGVGGPSGPTHTSGAVTTGGVTFTYVDIYKITGDYHIAMEGNCILCDGTSVNQSGNASPNHQFVINSASGYGNQLYLVAVNNISASSNVRGIAAGDATIHAEFNTFAAPAQMPSTLNPNSPYILGNGTVRARKNIVGYTTSTATRRNIINTPDGGTTISPAVLDEANVAVDWISSSPGANTPDAVLRGTFTFGTGARYVIQDDGLNTPAEFRSQMSKTLHRSSGVAGGRMTELWPVTVTDVNTSQTATFTLAVAP